MADHSQTVGLLVDVRNPMRSAQPYPILYDEVLHLAQVADQLGFGYLWLSEHHFADDGYLPSPLLFVAALTQRTRTIRLATAVVPLPFHHPVRLAEDRAILDILSDGRFELGVGIGWRKEEFAAFGADWDRRGIVTDERLRTLRSLWDGGTLAASGVAAGDDRVSPRPQRATPPLIWVGGYGRRAARRAARLGDGFVVSDMRKELYETYLHELDACGKGSGHGRVASGFRWFFVSRDPSATFSELAPYVIDWYQAYARWAPGDQRFPTVTSPDDLRDLGLLQVVSPAHAVDLISEFVAEVPCHSFNIKLRPPGYPLSSTIKHLELFAAEVLPQLSGVG